MTCLDPHDQMPGEPCPLGCGWTAHEDQCPCDDCDGAEQEAFA